MLDLRKNLSLNAVCDVFVYIASKVRSPKEALKLSLPHLDLHGLVLKSPMLCE